MDELGACYNIYSYIRRIQDSPSVQFSAQTQSTSLNLTRSREATVSYPAYHWYDHRYWTYRYQRFRYWMKLLTAQRVRKRLRRFFDRDAPKCEIAAYENENAYSQLIGNFNEPGGNSALEFEFMFLRPARVVLEDYTANVEELETINCDRYEDDRERNLVIQFYDHVIINYDLVSETNYTYQTSFIEYLDILLHVHEEWIVDAATDFSEHYYKKFHWTPYKHYKLLPYKLLDLLPDYNSLFPQFVGGGIPPVLSDVQQGQEKTPPPANFRRDFRKFADGSDLLE